MKKTSNISHEFEESCLSNTAIDFVQWKCGDSSGRGVVGVPEWQDWSQRATTPDQKRIEDVFDTQKLDGKSVLHVGVGNSNFAQRFHSRVERLDGITIQESEAQGQV